jgi:hypothetical protein
LRARESERDTLSVAAIVRKPISSPASVPLGDWVESRLAKRIRFTAWNFFKEPYDHSQHRTRFVAFLASLVEGRSDTASGMARRLGALLSPPTWPVSTDVCDHESDRDRAWLAAFFLEEPEWEAKVAGWTRGTGSRGVASPPRSARSTSLNK